MLSIGWFDFLSIIQVYLEQLEAGSVSKLVGRYFWDKNVCCVFLPQHHIMIYLLMSKHRMSNDGMPFQRYNHTNWLLGRKGPGPKIMLSIFPSSRQSWYMSVGSKYWWFSTFYYYHVLHMYWYLACNEKSHIGLFERKQKLCSCYQYMIMLKLKVILCRWWWCWWWWFGDKYQLCSFSAFQVFDAPLFGRPGLVHHACLEGAGSSSFPWSSSSSSS